MGNYPRRRSPTATKTRTVLLLSATGAPDPTYRAVLSGLTRALPEAGWATRVAGTPRVAHLHVAGHVRREVARRVHALLARGARLVLTFQDLDHPDMPPRSRAQDALLGALVRRASAVTALTPALARRVRAAFPDAGRKLSVVGNGVGPLWLAPGRAPRAAGGVVAAARLCRYKGVDLLLWAFRDLLDSHPDASLTLYGRDLQRGYHAGLASRLGLRGRVRFAGEVSHRRLRGAVRRARLFVSASRAETFGMAVLEALAAGARVVATRTEALPAIARRVPSLRLVRPGDAAALARAMLAAWPLPRPGRAAVSRVRRELRRHRWDLRAREYAGLYERA